MLLDFLNHSSRFSRDATTSKLHNHMLIQSWKHFIIDKIKYYCNTLVLTLFALNVYDVYNVIDRGVELKEKAPTSIWLCHVSAIEIVADGIS